MEHPAVNSDQRVISVGWIVSNAAVFKATVIRRLVIGIRSQTRRLISHYVIIPGTKRLESMANQNCRCRCRHVKALLRSGMLRTMLKMQGSRALKEIIRRFKAEAMKADPFQIGDVAKEPKRPVVPIYQRTYAWKIKPSVNLVGSVQKIMSY